MTERSTACLAPRRGAATVGHRLIGTGRASGALLHSIVAVAPRPATVLIQGETGVGKEVAAREIHARSRRAVGPFVPVDCTAFSSELIESQLFGHVAGAFTGAVSAALGFLRCADGGTLLLDEVGELPLPAQAKLLRSIQERAVVPVGGVEPAPIDIRLIAATHRDLAQMVREGTFRQDLYFRLNVVRLTIPPLRERREDIVPLARHFLEEIALAYEEPNKSLLPAAEARLLEYDWPGNVRELRNTMERAFLFCGDRAIQVEHLPAEIRDAAGCTDGGGRGAVEDRLPSLAEAERLLIARALKLTGGNQSETARMLDVERHRLRRKIVLHHLEHLLPRSTR